MTLNDLYQLLGMKEAELHATRLERDKLRAELAELKNKTIKKPIKDKKQ